MLSIKKMFWLNTVFIVIWLLFIPVSAKSNYELMTLSDQNQVTNYGLYNSSYPSISSDGRFVTFFSGANDLVISPATGEGNIFLRDVLKGTTELISQSTAGVQGNAGSTEISDISDDGCLIVFESYASNLDADTNKTKDIFLRDRCSLPHTTKLISFRPTGEQTSWGNGVPDITPDGRYVVYENGDYGVCRYDIQTGSTIALTGDKKTGSRPSISDDGKRVAFYSYWPLLPEDNNGVWDIYLWDESSGLSLVSTASDGSQRDQGDESSSRVVAPAISGDGQFVSFATTAANLVPNDTGNYQDVFVKEIQTGKLTRVSVTDSGEQGDSDSPTEQGGKASLSRTGSWVVFETNAKNLTKGQSSGTVIHNIATGETISIDSIGRFGDGYRPAISNDTYGRFIAFYAVNYLDNRYNSAGVFRYDRHALPVAIANIEGGTIEPAAVDSTVTLDGSGSHNASNANFFAPLPNPGLRYQWQKIEGPVEVTLSDPTLAKPSFKASKEGKYRFQLVVSDTVEDSLPATVTVEIGSSGNPDIPNVKPLADAGEDLSAPVGGIVNLDGSASSDAEMDSLSFHWKQLSGPISVTLTGANSAQPHFKGNLAGSYSFVLVVNDGKEDSLPDVVNIIVGDGEATNIPPVAIAGDDQEVNVGEAVILDGSESYDPESAGLSYQWRQIGGSTQVLSNVTNASASFTPQIAGSYSFELKVSDGVDSSLPDVLTITVNSSTSGNQLPVAVVNLDTPTVTVGSPVKLSGSGSFDADRTSKKLKYQWTQTDGPITVSLINSKSASPKFTPTEPGDYVFELAVFDGIDWSRPQTLLVHVEGSIKVTAPASGTSLSFDLGAPIVVNYEVLGLTPKGLLKPYLLWMDEISGELQYFPFKQKAKASATSVKLSISPSSYSSLISMGAIPNNAVIIALCYNENFCGISELLGVE